MLGSRSLFFNDTATTEIYTLSLHDALPISRHARRARELPSGPREGGRNCGWGAATTSPIRGCGRATGRRRPAVPCRSEEHTSELQSRQYLVCRLLLEKKKTCTQPIYHSPQL